MSAPAGARFASLRELIEGRRILICCGSGGVGKTTTSASLALTAALLGKKAVVCTIDPARRLANSLGLSELGNEVVQVAPERFADGVVRSGVEVSRCDIEREALPFADDSFDLVLMNELFEHLRIQPIATLEEVLRVIRPGGRLMLSTPNLRSLRGVRNLLLHNQGHASSAGVYRQYDKLRTLGHMGHVREYTTYEVCEFLERIGFEVEELVFRGGHGRGAVGLLERWLPAWRPFFTVVAQVPKGVSRPEEEP